MTWLEIIENILFYSALYVLFLYALALTLNKGIPNIKTAPAIRNKMIDLIRADMKEKNKSSYIIYDLGAGSGHLTTAVAKAIPEAQVIGIEIAKIPYWKATIRAKVFGPKNVSYRNGDLKKTDISDADAVTMFLSWLLMTPIREALESGLSKDTLITSNKFPLGGDWKPREVIDVDTLYPHQKKLYVYKGKPS